MIASIPEPGLNMGVVLERPSVEEWVLGVLRDRGAQTLDQLGGSLPEVNWAQLFLAIDRLSRSGKISMWNMGPGDYLLSINKHTSSLYSGRL
ncbi:MAG: hypothetical protein C4293_06445 [Nitrospiraceae bacterium]